MSSFPEDYSKQEIEEMIDEYRVFKQAREHAMASAQLPPDDTDLSFGEPPFILHDDPAFYAVLFADGSVEPLPFGYELDDDDLDVPDSSSVGFNTMMLGGQMLRYWPLRRDFEMPDNSSFELEKACQAREDQAQLDGLNFNGFMYSDAKTGKAFTGTGTSTWPNGRLRRKAQIRDGLLDGTLTWWYENGQKELETEYVDGERHGTHQTWHENGQQWADMRVDSGLTQGRCRWWYDNGQLKEEATYVDDELHGVARQWYENGNLLVDVELVDGAKQGPWRQWHENGQLAVEVTCVDDEPHGRLRQWDEDGELVRESQWEYGEKISEDEDEDEPEEDLEALKEQILSVIHDDDVRANLEAELDELIETADDEDVDSETIAAALREIAESAPARRESILEEGRPKLEAKKELIEATANGDLDEVRRLLAEGAECDIGAPGLAWAIMTGQEAVFDLYIEQGADVAVTFDWRNPDGSVLEGANVLALAAAGGLEWAVKKLIGAGALRRLKKDDLVTALTAAIFNKRDRIVQYIVAELGDLSDPAYGRALVGAAMNGLIDLVKQLLKLGVPVDAPNRDGWTALKMAAKAGDYKTAKTLIDAGADCDARDGEGWTALLNAIENGDNKMVELLLKSGADPNAAPDDRDSENPGFSALMRAAQYGKLKILKNLIKAGADVNQPDQSGYSAAIYAKVASNTDCLDYLCKHGATVDQDALDELREQEEDISRLREELGQLIAGIGDSDDDDEDASEELDEVKAILQERIDKLFPNTQDTIETKKPKKKTKSPERKKTAKKKSETKKSDRAKAAPSKKSRRRPIDEVVEPGLIRFQYDDCINKEAAVRQRLQLHLKVAFAPLFEKGSTNDADIINTILEAVRELDEGASVTFPVVVNDETLLTFEFVR